MLNLKCLDKKHKNGCVVSYLVQDMFGNSQEVDAKLLKDLIRQGRVHLIGYELSSSNRIIKSKKENPNDDKMGQLEKYMAKYRILGNNTLDFKFENDILIEYVGKNSKLAIPPVSGIANKTFKDNKVITSIQIPNSIRKIGAEAFIFCETLKKVVFVEPNNIVIGTSAFRGSGIEELRLPTGMVQIYPSCFSKCANLKEVYISDTVQNIGVCAFSYCNKLEKVVIGNGLKTIEKYAFLKSKIAKITLNNGLELIEDGAFKDTELTSIIIPDSVRKIGDNCFKGSKLTQAYIGAGLKDITGITSCESLKKIEISPKNPYMVKKDGIIYSCNNKTIVWVDRDKTIDNLILDSVTDIEPYAFFGMSIGNLEIPEHVYRVGDYAFFNAEIESLVCNATTIGNSTFQLAKIGDVTINCRTINSWAFSEANIKNMRCNADYIFSSAFERANMDKVICNCGIIGTKAFYMSGINKILVNAEEIGELAFSCCSNLNQVIIGEYTRIIGDSSFYHCLNLNNITDNSKKSVEVKKYAFANTAIKKIKFNNVQKIHDGAFRDCKQLKEIYIGKDTKVHFDFTRYTNNVEVIRL